MVDALPGKDARGRNIFYIDDTDFATMHNFLYYWYTGRVNMYDERNDPAEETGDVLDSFTLEGYPEPIPSAFKLYITAICI